MDDNDSIITDFSVIETPGRYRNLPDSKENSLNIEDFTSTNSNAVIKALQSLQQKIKKLELERVQAEQKFGSLAQETDRYKDMLKDKQAKRTEDPPTEMYRLQPTTTSTPSQPADDVIAANSDVITSDMSPLRLNYNPGSPDRPDNRALYRPSSSQPYATYVRKPKDKHTDKPVSDPTKRLQDSRVNILEKQLEYMRRLVQNAEQERSRATERMCQIEQEKENKAGKNTELELEKQKKKISDLEIDCSKLNNAHILSEEKISRLEDKLQAERQNHEKLIQQTEELTKVTEENKNLMLSITPSLPPSPEPRLQKSKKNRKRPSSTPGGTAHHRPPARATSVPPLKPQTIPFVCGRSAHPSHSLAANVQQMLSALQHDNTARCARITTQKKSGRSSCAANTTVKEIKHVIRGLEDDLGALTFEYQNLGETSDKTDTDTTKRLNHISEQMERKTLQIKKLKTCLKKMESESKVLRASAAPAPRGALSTISNKEVQICLRGNNTRELLHKVKTIKDVLTNKDIHWV